MAPDGRIWGSELQGNRVFSFDPRGGTFDVLDLPTPWSGPRRMELDARGTLWIPEYANNALTSLDPRTKRFTRHPLPVADALPYVVRVDRTRSRVWIGTGAADAILRFDPRTGRFTVYPLPTRGAMVRHMVVDPAPATSGPPTAPPPVRPPRSPACAWRSDSKEWPHAESAESAETASLLSAGSTGSAPTELPRPAGCR